MGQSRVGARDYSIQGETGRMGKGTRTRAPNPHNPRAAEKGRRQTEGPAGRVSSLADRGQGLQTDPLSGPCERLWAIWAALGVVRDPREDGCWVSAFVLGSTVRATLQQEGPRVPARVSEEEQVPSPKVPSPNLHSLSREPSSGEARLLRHAGAEGIRRREGGRKDPEESPP